MQLLCCAQGHSQKARARQITVVLQASETRGQKLLRVPQTIIVRLEPYKINELVAKFGVLIANMLLRQPFVVGKARHFKAAYGLPRL
eukprot:SAG31_NODE_1870_length_7027_cov_6.614319_4_plen_87_part_00